MRILIPELHDIILYMWYLSYYFLAHNYIDKYAVYNADARKYLSNNKNIYLMFDFASLHQEINPTVKKIKLEQINSLQEDD